MNEEEKLKAAAEMQSVVEQMRLDDLAENPALAEAEFECSCCGKTKSLAGSMQYGENRLCSDCVLLAETGLLIGKFKTVNELIKAMEDKRLEEMCDFIKREEAKEKN